MVTVPDTIRSRLTLLLSLLLLPLAAYVALFVWSSARQAEVRAEQTARGVAQLASARQRELFAGAQGVLAALAATRDPAGPGCAARLEALRDRFPAYHNLIVTDPAGAVLCAAAPMQEGASVAGMEWFRQAAARGDFVIGDFQLGAQPADAAVVAALAWRDRPDATGIAGTVAVSLRLEALRREMEAVALPRGAEVFLADRSGRVLVAEESQPLPLPPDRLRAALAGGTGVFSADALDVPDGGDRLYAVAPIEGGGLAVLLSVPRRALLGWSPAELALWLGAPLLLWGAMLAGLWWATDRLIVGHVGALSQAVRAYSGGNRGVRPAEAGPRELRELAQAFGRMAGDIDRREGELQAALAASQAMLREIHHRVKNNLQIVSSLINLQLRGLEEPAAREAFRDIQTRVRALAIVHRYLYEGEHLNRVDLAAFLAELCQTLRHSHGRGEDVALEIEAESVWEETDRAIPLALFMTEALSNAFKHAFPVGYPGNVAVELKRLSPQRVRFRVADTGVGLARNDNGPDAGRDTLGLSLIAAFARQVGGDLTIDGPPGTVVDIEFTNRADSAPPAKDAAGAKREAAG
ncbi:MAG TPA: histidine kinase dimerization/phosphoacceptor domain -containing protein [Alphaproteobacteria bacterium]|nr:histidine kinase dimerization/phosphoacceptor domain -containing protein [Alphaproteobacteria bacterium]